MARIGAFYMVSPEDWYFTTHGDVVEAKRRAEEYRRKHGTLDGAEYHIEEFVRQWALHQLVSKYNYPASWIGERIIIEESVRMGSTEKQADISIRNTSRRTFIYLEVKKRGVDAEEFNGAEKQLESYLSSTHTATIGLVTDGDRVKAIRKKIDPNDFDYISDIYQYEGGQIVHSKLVRDVPATSDKKLTGLTPISEAYERVLFDCHSVIRDIDGLHDDEALDELSKMIYVKIYDEKQTVKAGEGAEFKFQIYGASNPAEVASNIRLLYEQARDSELEVYSKRIPNYERSRGVFKTQIKLSDPSVYAIVERLQNYSLVDTKADIKGRAFQGVLSSAIRAGMGQYFTPHPVVEMAVRIIDPNVNDVILDPFCGSGHFLTTSLDYVMRKYEGKIQEKDLYEFKFFHLHGIEKSERMVRVAMTDMMLHDDGHTNIRNMDALLSFENYPDILALRDDGSQDPGVFSVILTNPPFGSLMRSEVQGMIGRFDLGKGKKSLPLEIIGLERSFQFLRPGGRMAIVLPDGLLKNKSPKYVRKWLMGAAQVKAIISLPEESFNAYGAMVKTSLCILRKYEEGEEPNEDYQTLLVEAENLGYDATGRSRNGSEVDAIVELFHTEAGWA